MSITLDAITLPEDLLWTNEYNWTPVAQSVKTSLSGAAVVQESVKQAQRPITLAGDEESAWILKSVLDQVQAKENTADLTMTLDIHGTVFTVAFDRSSNPINARLAAPYSNPSADDYYIVTLKFITV